ncbi:MAG: hypothetical protein ACYC6P_14335 [Ignavibacteriaceae bacterium]
MSELKQIFLRPFSSWLHKQLIDLNYPDASFGFNYGNSVYDPFSWGPFNLWSYNSYNPYYYGSYNYSGNYYPGNYYPGNYYSGYSLYPNYQNYLGHYNSVNNSLRSKDIFNIRNNDGLRRSFGGRGGFVNPGSSVLLPEVVL